MRYYTGIGARETPLEILEFMTLIASKLYHKGYKLRSGGARGADTAFEIGAKDRKTIFLPWNGFEDKYENGIDYIVPPFDALSVKHFHPKPEKLTERGKLLMSRNQYQITGLNDEDHSDFVICWTKDGLDSGGTGQALRIARFHKIQVFNLHSVFDRIHILKFLNQS